MTANIALHAKTCGDKMDVCDGDFEVMTGETRRLGVVIGQPARARSPELILFKELNHFRTQFISSTEVRKLLPESVGKILFGEPYGPQGFFRLPNLEGRLKNIDVISCIEVYSFISHQCADLAKKKKKKLAVSVFETIPSIPFHYSPPYSWNVRSVVKHADVFIAYTNRAKDYLRHLSAPSEKIKVIYPGVDIQAFSPLNKHDHDGFHILFVGRLSYSKGFTFLLEAFSRLCSGNQNVELWICGTGRTGGKEQALARAMAKKYPIKVLGYIEHDRLPNVYRECNVLCLPSLDMKRWGIRVWEEQFGFAAAEAMACGLPIIATNCGAIPEVIGTQNIVVPQRSVDALCLALRKIMEDNEMRKNVSRANRARAERLFDIRKQREELDQVLMNCSNGKTR